MKKIALLLVLCVPLSSYAVEATYRSAPIGPMGPRPLQQHLPVAPTPILTSDGNVVYPANNAAQRKAYQEQQLENQKLQEQKLKEDAEKKDTSDKE